MQGLDSNLFRGWKMSSLVVSNQPSEEWDNVKIDKNNTKWSEYFHIVRYRYWEDKTTSLTSNFDLKFCPGPIMDILLLHSGDIKVYVLLNVVICSVTMFISYTPRWQEALWHLSSFYNAVHMLFNCTRITCYCKCHIPGLYINNSRAL